MRPAARSTATCLSSVVRLSQLSVLCEFPADRASKEGTQHKCCDNNLHIAGFDLLRSGLHRVCLCPADGDYGWGLLLRTLADVLQHDRRPAVVDASLEMVFGLLASYSARWDAAAWRVLTQRVVRHMLSLPPGLSPPTPQAALDSLSSRPLGKQPASLSEGSPATSTATATSRLAVASGTGFGSPVGGSGSGGSSAVSSLSGGQGLPPAAFGSVLSQLGGGGVGGGGGGAGGAVQVGMSVAEQGLLMTTMLKRMDRYYPLLCDQAAHIRAEYRVSCIMPGCQRGWGLFFCPGGHLYSMQRHSRQP
jgi:hypothetical protein